MATVSGGNKKYYEDKGYKLPYSKDKRGRIGIPKGTQIEVSVFDIHPSSSIRVKYSCDDCGLIQEVRAYTIFSRKNSEYSKTGKTFCSNCANKRMSGVNSPAYKHGSQRYPEYRYNARKRGILFELSVDEFKKLTNEKCFYCGGHSKDRNPQSRGNGIDRKDSSKGYNIENCVTCCATCNFVKNNMPFEDFIKWVRDVYKNTAKLDL